MIIAAKLYEMGRLSKGSAAAFAEVPKPLFLSKLADYSVDTFDSTRYELQRSGQSRDLTERALAIIVPRAV